MNRPTLAALGVSAALLLSSCAGTSSDRSAAPAPPQAAGGTVVMDSTSMPPWAAPSDAPERAAQAGLDLGPMGMAEHYHPVLRVVIDGTDVPVPPNIGVDPTTGAMSAVHTHEDDGTIHIEADSEGEVFTLGQFFTEWGVMLTPDQIGGVRAEPGQRVEVSSNGKPVTGDPADLRLEPDQQIVVSLG